MAIHYFIQLPRISNNRKRRLKKSTKNKLHTKETLFVTDISNRTDSSSESDDNGGYDFVCIMTETRDHRHQNDRLPILPSPAWKRSPQSHHSPLHAHFIDQEPGAVQDNVVTEVRTFARIAPEDAHHFFYSSQEIEAFRREEHRRVLGGESYQCKIVRSKTVFDFHEFIKSDNDEKNEELQEEDKRQQDYDPSAQAPTFKCVGFVDRADGRQGASVVTESYAVPLLEDHDRDSLYYSEQDYMKFREEILSEAEFRNSPLLEKIFRIKKHQRNNRLRRLLHPRPVLQQ